MKKPVLVLLIISLGYCSVVRRSPALAQEPFYRGKTIRLIVGSTSGGFYDRWARMFAKAMPKYIAGIPEIIVQNMPGAGSVVAANYLYNVAKPDGLTMAIVQYSVYMDQLVGRKEAQFDVRRFGWIGSPASETGLLYMRSDAPYKSIRDIIKAKEPPKCGSSGTVSTDYLLARLLEDSIGARITSVLGYPGGAEIDLAVEKNEVVCRSHNISAHFGREPFNSWHKKDFDRHIVQTGSKRDPRLPDTPTIYQLFDEYKAPELSRRVSLVILGGGELGRPFLVTPGTPADRLKILRDAYMRAATDSDLAAEAGKARMDIDPTPGDELEGLIKKLMDQPNDVIERVKKMMAN
jgi:tripartite-type tricarboxylate transporter receptor subunit TctC